MITLITHNGITDTKSGWAKRLGITRQAFNIRIRSGLVGAALFGNRYDNRKAANELAAEFCRKNPDVEKVCAVCKKSKKLIEFRTNGRESRSRWKNGAARFYHICRKCEETTNAGKKCWVRDEEMEMAMVRRIRTAWAGLPISQIGTLPDSSNCVRLHLDP